jgi:hypothetical protein
MPYTICNRHQLAELLTEARHARVDCSLRKRLTKESIPFCIPVVGECHWVTIAVWPLHRRLYLLDPLSSPLSLFPAHLRELLANAPHFAGWETIDTMAVTSHPVQGKEDSHSCGLLAILFPAHLGSPHTNCTGTPHAHIAPSKAVNSHHKRGFRGSCPTVATRLPT